jgi:hypothetical protein
MVLPQEAEVLPGAYTRAMVIAVLLVWLMHALWPKVVIAARPAAMAPFAAPLTITLTGTAIVLPLMLVFLLYGLTDALPVLMTTVVLVVNFDPRRSATQGMAMIIGDLLGGMIAIVAYALIQVSPSLPVLALTTFLVAILFARWMNRGGAFATVGQFAIACLFAIGMMRLFLPRNGRIPTDG